MGLNDFQSLTKWYWHMVDIIVTLDIDIFSENPLDAYKYSDPVALNCNEVCF